VSMGRKLWLFVYYVKLIDNKLWMVEEAVALNGGMKSRMVGDKIKRRIAMQTRSFFFLHQFQVMVGWAC